VIIALPNNELEGLRLFGLILCSRNLGILFLSLLPGLYYPFLFFHELVVGVDESAYGRAPYLWLYIDLHPIGLLLFVILLDFLRRCLTFLLSRFNQLMRAW
jgi:hypothetical protein